MTKVQQVQQVPVAHVVYPDAMGYKALPVVLVLREPLVPEPLVLQDSPEYRVLMELQEPPELRVYQELQVQVAPLVQVVLRV